MNFPRGEEKLVDRFPEPQPRMEEAAPGARGKRLGKDHVHLCMPAKQSSHLERTSATRNFLAPELPWTESKLLNFTW